MKAHRLALALEVRHDEARVHQVRDIADLAEGLDAEPVLGKNGVSRCIEGGWNRVERTPNAARSALTWTKGTRV